MSNQQIVFPTVIRVRKDTTEIEVPDLHIKVVGNNYTEAIGRTIEHITAICNYRKERNIPIRITETYDSLVEKTSKERLKHFIYMLSTLDEQ